MSQHDNVKTGRAETPGDPAVVALGALAHVAGDPDLAPRFLALSGLDAPGLRASADDPRLLAAVIDFLAARETDLVACADAIGVTPQALTDAGRRLADASGRLTDAGRRLTIA